MRALARMIAVVALGLTWAAIWWRIELVSHGHGREAFLAAQARRFDMFYPQLAVSFVARGIAAAILLMGLIIVVYESLAFGIYKLISPRQRDRDVSTRT